MAHHPLRLLALSNLDIAKVKEGVEIDYELAAARFLHLAIKISRHSAAAGSDCPNPLKLLPLHVRSAAATR